MSAYVEDACCVCGIAFCVPERWRNARRQDGATFYCPNGHAQSFRETEADRLRRQLQNEQQQRARLEQEAKAARDAEAGARMREGKAKAELARVRTRVQGGACPDCNRTFADLARHMTTKHGAKASALQCTQEVGHA